MSIKTIEIMHKTGETSDLKLFFRPPSRSEIEGFQREIMAMRTLTDADDSAKIAGSQTFQAKLLEAGEKMLLRTDGIVPDWYIDEKRKLDYSTDDYQIDYVNEYHSPDLARFALEILQVAIGGVMPAKAVEAAQTKN